MTVAVAYSDPLTGRAALALDQGVGELCTVVTFGQ